MLLTNVDGLLCLQTVRARSFYRFLFHSYFENTEDYSTIRLKANSIVHILPRNCLIKHVTEAKVDGRIEVTVRRGRRQNQLMEYLKEGKDAVNWQRKHVIALCADLALEEAMDLS
jgi:hypothetical protein